MNKVSDLPLDKISRDPEQPRKYFSERSIGELADSISEHGLLQPILVRPWNGEYKIVHGERRYRACVMLGLPTIRAFVKDLSDSEASDFQLVENVDRDDLSDIELAWEFDKRAKRGQTHEDIAKVVGKKRSYVTQRLALLKLPEKEQQRMLRGELSFSNARLLLSIKDPNIRDQVSREISEKTTVKQTLSLVKPDSDVTRVTVAEGLPDGAIVDVGDLAVYKLVTANSKLSVGQLVPAYVQDLKRFRGSING